MRVRSLRRAMGRNVVERNVATLKLWRGLATRIQPSANEPALVEPVWTRPTRRSS